MLKAKLSRARCFPKFFEKLDGRWQAEIERLLNFLIGARHPTLSSNPVAFVDCPQILKSPSLFEKLAASCFAGPALRGFNGPQLAAVADKFFGTLLISASSGATILQCLEHRASQLGLLTENVNWMIVVVDQSNARSTGAFCGLWAKISAVLSAPISEGVRSLLTEKARIT
jgi:hypothetical protein